MKKSDSRRNVHRVRRMKMRNIFRNLRSVDVTRRKQQIYDKRSFLLSSCIFQFIIHLILSLSRRVLSAHSPSPNHQSLDRHHSKVNNKTVTKSISVYIVKVRIRSHVKIINDASDADDCSRTKTGERGDECSDDA